MRTKTINDLIPTMKTGNGIFANITNPVWAELFTDPSQLDIYFSANYGRKRPTYYLEAFVGEDGKVSGESLSDLANAIYTMRSKEWEQLYKILTADYDPMENTQVTEEVTETKTGSGTDGNTRTLGTSKTITGSGQTTGTGHSETEGSASNAQTEATDTTDTKTGSNNGANNVFGFDSVAAVGHDTSSLSTSDTDVIDTDVSISGTSSDTSETSSTSSTTSSSTSTEADSGTIRDQGSNSYSETFTREYSKHGNIGVMSNVALFSESVDFYRWDFIRQICEDICQYIALAVY